MTTITELNRAAQLADDIWQIALEVEFGIAASEMRYTDKGKGAEGTGLRAAYEARTKALEAWLAATRAA